MSPTTFCHDARGFLWIGGSQGIDRFDGQTFTNYTVSADTMRPGLPHKNVHDIVIDENEHLWIGTSGGISLFKPELEQFTNFTDVGNCQNCLAGWRVRCLLLDDDRLWIGTNAGLSVIHLKTHDIETWWYDKESELEQNEIDQLIAIREMIHLDTRRIAMATDEGLVVFDKVNNKFTFFDQDDGLFTKGLGSIFKDNKGSIWLGSDRDGVYKMEGNWEKPRFIHMPSLIANEVEKTTVYSFTNGPKGQLWIGTYEGLSVYDPSNERVHYYRQNMNDPYAISHNVVKRLFSDRDGRVWMGTMNGLDSFDPARNQFQLLRHDPQNNNSLSSNNVFAVLEDRNGYMWFGTQETGISVMWKDENDKEKFHHIRPGKAKNQLRGSQIFSLEEDQKGRIWACAPEGLHIIDWRDRDQFDYTIEVFEKGPFSENKLPHSNIYQIINDRNNKTWLATHGSGIVTIDENMLVGQIKYEDQDPLQTVKDYVINLDFDNNGRLWTGNFNLGGAVVHNPEMDTVFRRITGDEKFYLNNVNDYTFFDQQVLVNTTAGVIHYPSVTSLLQDSSPVAVVYGTNEGLPGAMALQTVQVNDSLFWVSTSRGLATINIDARQLTSYSHLLDKSTNIFRHNAAAMTKDSTIYFGTANGAVRFNHKDIASSLQPPQLYFSNFRILNEPVAVASTSNGKTVTPMETSYLDELTLQPRDKIFSIDVGIIQLTRNEELSLEYKIEGFDEKWIQKDNQIITRSNLKPGTYILRARAMHREKVHGPESVLSIKVLPPWWQKWWAKILFLLSIFGIIRTIIWSREKRAIKLEKVKSAERENFRKRSAQDFHDEAGTKITRISLLTELLKKKISADPETNKLVGLVEKNIAELNLGMRDFIWTLDADKDNLFDTLNRFIEFAGDLCEQANILFKPSGVEHAFKDIKMEMEHRRHLLLILKEALNNSIKHSQATEIAFHSKMTKDQIFVELIDNGIGFKNNGEQKGNGLKNMGNRAKELGGKVNIPSDNGKGTAVEITLSVP